MGDHDRNGERIQVEMPARLGGSDASWVRNEGLGSLFKTTTRRYCCILVIQIASLSFSPDCNPRCVRLTVSAELRIQDPR